MPNNNPGGTNAYGTEGVEEPYGAIERRKVLTRMAPPGQQAVAAALNTPQRNQRRATKRQSSVTSHTSPPPPSPAEAPQLSPLSRFWQDLAAEPGASDLVKRLAEEANG